ncbi:hypothetical protein BGZ83_003440 [Gryganskiella cystojenkinii]|nr:hypothetical protein BGZ83_003440 [Gryganskiella cystojenkinii]
MEGRITRRASASAAASASNKDTASESAAASASVATPVTGTTSIRGRGGSPARARRGTSRPRGRPRGSTRKTPRNESRSLPNNDEGNTSAMEQTEDDMNETSGDEDHAHVTDNNPQAQPQAELVEAEVMEDTSGSNTAGDVPQPTDQPHASTQMEADDGRNNSESLDASRLAASQVYDEMAELPFISPSLPPTFVPKPVDPLQKKIKFSTDTSATTESNSRSWDFLDEGLYNKLSIGGVERIAEVFHYQRGTLKIKSALTAERRGSTSEESAPKRQKMASTTSKSASSLSTIDEGDQQSQTHADTNQNSTSSTAASSSTGVTPGQKAYDLDDLMATARSYVPSFNSAIRSLEAVPAPASIQQQSTSQSQQQTELLPLSGIPTRFYHPCIISHDHRSMLTREEHQRSIMYDAYISKRSELPPLDKVVWLELQAKIEQERQRVRQWNASTVRSRISNYYNPAIRDALESKFSRARTRVKEDYPQNFVFLKTVGLRRPGPPPGTKEAILARAVPKEVPESARSATLPPIQRRSGLLHRTGQVCAVSLTKPIWPTDENGVPFEKTVDVDDRYWKNGTSSSSSSEQPKQGKSLTGRDNRRGGCLPVKRPVVAVSNDPLTQQFVREQNVHIAIGASAMVALAKLLPSLSNEWEIPVKVVMEPDEEGTMQKRVYIDKPLIAKRITKLGVTQLFYDGVCKKLSLIGSSSTDVHILSESAPKAEGSNATSSKSEPAKPLSSSDTATDTARSMGSTVESAPASDAPLAMLKELTKTNDAASSNDNEEGTLGSHLESAGAPSCHSLEYSLWTFGELRILIRNRIQGYISNTDPSLPPRQVVLKTVLDYAPDIGLLEANKSVKAGWWMATWIRNDRLLALARVDVSRNQFVRYTGLAQPTAEDPENPFKGVFSDLPAIAVEDTAGLKDKDQEIQEWIKPNMRLIHVILGSLRSLSPGQYILGHKAGDVNANVYQAQKDAEGSAEATKKTTATPRIYDLHAAHEFSPLLVADQQVEGEVKLGSLVEDDPILRWTGTPDQIVDTFPYNDPEPVAKPKVQYPRSQSNNKKGGKNNKNNKGNSKSKKNK